MWLRGIDVLPSWARRVFWLYLDLDLLKRVLILTVDILVNCLLSFMFVLCLAQGLLPIFFPYDGKGNSRITLRLMRSFDIYVQHVGSHVVHTIIEPLPQSLCTEKCAFCISDFKIDAHGATFSVCEKNIALDAIKL